MLFTGGLDEEAVFGRADCFDVAGGRGRRAAGQGAVSQHGISEQTFYRWKTKYGGMEVSDARRLKTLESENAKLKRMLAEQLLVVEGLREIAKGKY